MYPNVVYRQLSTDIKMYKYKIKPSCVSPKAKGPILTGFKATLERLLLIVYLGYYPYYLINQPTSVPCLKVIQNFKIIEQV